MKIRSVLAASLGALALVAAGSSSAFAGEVTGTGSHTPPHTYRAASVCSFSGLQDGDDNDDGMPDGPSGPGVTPQNFGQTLLEGKAAGLTMDDAKEMGANPGQACNPNTPPPVDGTP